MSVNPPSPFDLAVLNSLSNEQLFWVTAGVNQGLSANAIQRELINTPYGIRRQDLQAAVRAIQGIQSISAVANNTPFPMQPTSRVFTPTPRNIGANYRVRTYVDATLPSTGITERFFAYVPFDTIPTRIAILGASADQLLNATIAYGFSFATEDIVIATALRRAA